MTPEIDNQTAPARVAIFGQPSLGAIVAVGA